MQNSYILILAIGMILVIIAGHIDLSVGSVVAVVRRRRRGADGQPRRAVAARAADHAGRRRASIGAWQGYWIAYFGIPAFIVTLAGMLLFRALTLTVLGNQGIGPFPDEVRTLANGFTEGYLGNIGLGALGGADLFSLLVGAGRGGRHRRSPSGAPAPARLQLRPGRRPVAAVHRRRSSSPRSWSCP